MTITEKQKAVVYNYIDREMKFAVVRIVDLQTVTADDTAYNSAKHGYHAYVEIDFPDERKVEMLNESEEPELKSSCVFLASH